MPPLQMSIRFWIISPPPRPHVHKPKKWGYMDNNVNYHRNFTIVTPDTDKFHDQLIALRCNYRVNMLRDTNS